MVNEILVSRLCWCKIDYRKWGGRFLKKSHETYNLILGEIESRSSSESSEDEVDYPCEKSQCNVDIFYPKIIEIPYDP